VTTPRSRSAPQLRVTTHAIERYRLRFAHAADEETARRELRDLFALSNRVGDEANGHALFEGPPPARIRLVVAAAGTPAPSLVTVLYRSEHEWLRAFDDERPSPPPAPPRRVGGPGTLDRPWTELERFLVAQLREAMTAGLSECKRLRGEVAEANARADLSERVAARTRKLLAENRRLEYQAAGLRKELNRRRESARVDGELRAVHTEPLEDETRESAGLGSEFGPRRSGDADLHDGGLCSRGAVRLPDVDPDQSDRDTLVAACRGDGACIDRRRDGDLNGDRGERVGHGPSVTPPHVFIDPATGVRVTFSVRNAEAAAHLNRVFPRSETETAPTPPRGDGLDGEGLGARDAASVSDGVHGGRGR
jgi:hypothetical protein